MSSDVFEYMKLQAERGDVQAQVQYSTFELNPGIYSFFFFYFVKSCNAPFAVQEQQLRYVYIDVDA